MSILIKDMEMPKSCHCCRMCVQVSDGDIDWHWECCLLADKVERYATDRIPDCPLVTVPPHGDLIDRDANLMSLRKALYSSLADHGTIETAMLRACIKVFEEAPTVIEAEEET